MCFCLAAGSRQTGYTVRSNGGANTTSTAIVTAENSSGSAGLYSTVTGPVDCTGVETGTQLGEPGWWSSGVVVKVVC